MKWTKGINNALVTDPKEMDIYKLPDEESRMICLKNLVNCKNIQTKN